MSTPLSAAVQARLRLLFDGVDADHVAEVLCDEVAEHLPFAQPGPPERFDRVRLAALRLSGGDLAGFDRAVALAKQDWRDLLVAAGFAHDVTAHERWWPEPNGAEPTAG